MIAWSVGAVAAATAQHQQSILLQIASLGKDQNSEREVWFLWMRIAFHIIKLNHCKSWTVRVFITEKEEEDNTTDPRLSVHLSSGIQSFLHQLWNWVGFSIPLWWMLIFFKESRDKIVASSTILPLKEIIPKVIIQKQPKNIYRQPLRIPHDRKQRNATHPCDI